MSLLLFESWVCTRLFSSSQHQALTLWSAGQHWLRAMLVFCTAKGTKHVHICAMCVGLGVRGTSHKPYGVWGHLQTMSALGPTLRAPHCAIGAGHAVPWGLWPIQRAMQNTFFEQCCAQARDLWRVCHQTDCASGFGLLRSLFLLPPPALAEPHPQAHRWKGLLKQRQQWRKRGRGFRILWVRVTMCTCAGVCLCVRASSRGQRGMCLPCFSCVRGSSASSSTALCLSFSAHSLCAIPGTGCALASALSPSLPSCYAVSGIAWLGCTTMKLATAWHKAILVRTSHHDKAGEGFAPKQNWWGPPGSSSTPVWCSQGHERGLAHRLQLPGAGGEEQGPVDGGVLWWVRGAHWLPLLCPYRAPVLTWRAGAFARSLAPKKGPGPTDSACPHRKGLPPQKGPGP